MPDRYVALRPRPSSWGDDWYPDRPQNRLDVIETDPEPRFTGLYDQNGVPLYRVASRNPVGFTEK